MTTGRINQITRWGAPPGRAPTPGPKHQREVPPGRAHNPRGGQSVYQEGTPEGARPRRQPRRTGDDIDDHPIAPTKPLSTGPHAGVQRPGPPLRAGGGLLRHTALGRRVRPRGRRRRTAVPTGRLPPGIFASGVVSDHPSTDSGGAGDQRAPGLRTPPTRNAQNTMGHPSRPNRGRRTTLPGHSVSTWLAKAR